MQKPSVGKSVEIKMEEQINNFRLIGSPTREEAARVLLSLYPCWAWQTPEGEYLMWVFESSNVSKKEGVL